jgi:hypothetical protein
MLNTRPQARAVVRLTLLVSVVVLIIGVSLSPSRSAPATRLALSRAQITEVLRLVTTTMQNRGEITASDAAVAAYPALAAHDARTGVDWLYLQVEPRQPASYRADVAFQDDGSQWLLTRHEGGAWRRVTSFYFPPCARQVPSDVARVWGWATSGPDVTPWCAAQHPPR